MVEYELPYFKVGGILMAICYDKLWKLLIDKKMNRTELKEASGISFNVLARLGKNLSLIHISSAPASRCTPSPRM